MNIINTSKFDAVLIYDINENDIINEAFGDERYYTAAGPGKTVGKVPYIWYDDPKLHASNAFGQLMLRDLNNWRNGYSAKVSDFGKWVVVEVTYHDCITGRSASKTFLVVFDGGPKGDDKAGGMVLTTANKYRTISGYSQAAQYIKQVSSALESSASQKL
jgi:hypothetical protein